MSSNECPTLERPICLKTLWKYTKSSLSFDYYVYQLQSVAAVVHGLFLNSSNALKICNDYSHPLFSVLKMMEISDDSINMDILGVEPLLDIFELYHNMLLSSLPTTLSRTTDTVDLLINLLYEFDPFGDVLRYRMYDDPADYHFKECASGGATNGFQLRAIIGETIVSTLNYLQPLEPGRHSCGSGNWDVIVRLPSRNSSSKRSKRLNGDREWMLIRGAPDFSVGMCTDPPRRREVSSRFVRFIGIFENSSENVVVPRTWKNLFFCNKQNLENMKSIVN